jgi:Fe-S cluster biogenesis protein NfuA
MAIFVADHGNLQTLGERIKSLLGKLGSAPDSNTRQNAEELIQLLTQMYGAGLARILQILNEDEASKEFIDSLCKDNLVGSLLVLHGLHPDNVETRIERALVRVRPRLDAHGADVKLVKVDHAVAYLRLEGGRDGCATSAATNIRTTLKQALEETAPEIDAIEVEGLGLDRLWSRDDGISSSAAVKEAQRAGRCELCGNLIAETHGHVAEIETRRLLCACRACRFLFHGNGTARNKRKTVPQRFLYLAESVMTGPQWDELQIPVGLAFFFFNSALNRTVACYPGPAGATESLLPLESWNDIVRTHPVLEELSPDVEALLVDNVKERKSPACYVVPIDACYELVARLRRHWEGFDGGDKARREIEAFFAKLRSQSKGAALAR